MICIHHPQNYWNNSIGKHFQKAILRYRIINNICPDYLKKCRILTSDVSCRHTRSTNCNQLYTSKPNCKLFRKSFIYSGAAIWNSLPLHGINATLVNTFKSLYLKWKRLNDHWIISNITANLILYIYIDLINAYFMSVIWLAWFGIDVLVSVYYTNTLVSLIYTLSLLPTKLYWLLYSDWFCSYLIRHWYHIIVIY